jgi:hypothetical protein
MATGGWMFQTGGAIQVGGLSSRRIIQLFFLFMIWRIIFDQEAGFFFFFFNSFVST